MKIISGHQLVLADIAPAHLAQLAFATGEHGRYDHSLAQEVFRAIYHGAANLVAQGERQFLFGPYPMVPEAYVGMAYATARYLYQGLARGQRGHFRFHQLEIGLGLGHLVLIQLHVYLFFGLHIHNLIALGAHPSPAA
jgi:hypothetical protein